VLLGARESVYTFEIFFSFWENINSLFSFLIAPINMWKKKERKGGRLFFFFFYC
jgi:hypothetical protein